MKNFPEIKKLKSIYNAHNIAIKRLKRANREGFVLAEITIDSKVWNIYIDDEYGDCTKNKPLVAFYLMLFSLETYKDSIDYLDWCHQNLLDTSDLNWLDYYKTLETTYSEIKEVLGKIDSCISSLDYQLRTGVIDALFECEI